MLTTVNTREETQRVMVAKLTRLTYKIAIQLHLVVENCTICSSRSRQPVRKIWTHIHTSNASPPSFQYCFMAWYFVKHRNPFTSIRKSAHIFPEE
jgi:hypothetical protein